MSTTVLRLGEAEEALPPLEATLVLASAMRLALEAGPLRFSLPLDRDTAGALLGERAPFALGPHEDPVFLEGRGVLSLREARLSPRGGGRFEVEADGTMGWGPTAVPWTVAGEARVVRLEVEHQNEKLARGRLAEVLPAPPTEEWDVDAYEVPELGLWRIEVERRGP